MNFQVINLPYDEFIDDEPYEEWIYHSMNLRIIYKFQFGWAEKFQYYLFMKSMISIVLFIF